MHHVAVSLERHKFVDLLGTEAHHPAHIVTGKIHQHHVFGRLLRILDQLGGHAPLVDIGAAPPAGSRNRAGDDPPVEDLDHRLRRSSYHGEVPIAQEVHIRAGIHLP